MSPQVPVKIILGTHTIGDAKEMPGIIHFDGEQDVRNLLNAFHSRGYKDLDTASNYPGSEARLGQADAARQFTIHTKVHGWGNGDSEASKIESSVEKSLADLKTPSVETMFLHVPDRQTPFEETAKAMNDAFEQGKFKKWGISNYTAAELQTFLDICETKGYVKPSVYEGHYNAIVRSGEKELFPILRKHNMAFFAFSPAAGGLFSNNASTTARWKKDNGVGELYNQIYGQPAIQAAVAAVRDSAARHGISGHAAALRWTAFHSILDGKHGDALIFAVSKMEQLNDTLNAIEAGPLPTDLADAMTAVYASLDGSGPAYHL